MDMEHRNRNNSGRIIVLGDGTEVLTDSADSDMFDHDEEDDKGVAGGKRGQREGTPGPNQGTGIERTQTPEHTDESAGKNRFGSSDEPKMKAAVDAPEKKA